MSKRPPTGMEPSPDDVTTLLVVLFVLGRGSRGKTTLIRWLVEKLRAAGIEVTIADGDRTNATLRAFFADADSPADPDDATVIAWVYNQLERLAEKTGRHCLVFDFGGGDQALKRIAHELTLNDLLESDLGLRPVAVHLVGADLDDLSYVIDCEKNAVFAPKRTAVIFNESLVPSHIPFEEAYGLCKRSDVVTGIEERGTATMIMPPLRCATEVNERRLLFSDAMAGRGEKPLGPVQRRLVRTWDAKMEEALEPLLRWLRS